MAADPIRLAIHEALTEDATLSGLISGRVYYQAASQKATFPLVVFQRQSGTPMWQLDAHVQNDLWLVKAIATSVATAEGIADAIDTAMNKPLTVDGGTVLTLPTREQDVTYLEDDGGVLYRHHGAIYRIYTEG